MSCSPLCLRPNTERRGEGVHPSLSDNSLDCACSTRCVAPWRFRAALLARGMKSKKGFESGGSKSDKASKKIVRE